MENILMNWAIIATLVLSLIFLVYLSYNLVELYPKFDTNFKKSIEYNEYCMKNCKKLSNLQIKFIYLFCILGTVFIFIPFFFILFCLIIIFGLFMLIISLLFGISVTDNLIMFYVFIPFVYFLYLFVSEFLFKNKSGVKETV